MKIEAIKNEEERICQGDIIANVEHIDLIAESEGVIEISRIVFPLAIVLTQDCDLKYSSEKLLSVLVAPLYNAEHVYEGTHLSELRIGMGPINKKKTEGEYLQKNERPRYHYLDFKTEIPIVPSVIDFKHYFSVNVDHLQKIKESNYICTISELFREDISLRFANFLARIGLPEPKTE